MCTNGYQYVLIFTNVYYLVKDGSVYYMPRGGRGGTSGLIPFPRVGRSSWDLQPGIKARARENLILLRKGRCTIKMSISSPLIMYLSVGSNQK